MISSTIDEIVRLSIDEHYLTRQQVPTSELVAEVKQRCGKAGVCMPSRNTIVRRLRIIAPADLVARRHKRRTARALYAPVTGSLEAPRPLSLMQVDHTLVDVMVVDSVARRPIQRPWLTLAIDVHSRCVAGFHLSLEPPCATSVALCLAQACLPKKQWLASRVVDAAWPVAGIPERLHLDNAKEFHSEALRRGCEQYGIAIDYRPVRTPHYGGHIERLIGTVMGKVHLLPGTTFSDPRQKGDYNPAKTAAMTLDEVERWLAHAICGLYHGSMHRGIDTTPVAQWQRGVQEANGQPKTGTPAGVPDQRRFLIDFLPLERRLVRREGVALHSIAYWSDVLRVWVKQPDKMIVRSDPRDLSRIYLLAPDGVYYDLPYRDLRRPPISLWERRLALARLRAEGRVLVDEHAIFRIVATMREIAETATAETRKVRRQQERRRRTMQVVHVEQQAPEPPAVAAPEPAGDASQGQPHEHMFSVEEW